MAQKSKLRDSLQVEMDTKRNGVTGYIIQVKSYADSSGNAAMNQQLSIDRAQAVLANCCKIAEFHFVTSWRQVRWE